MLALMLMLLVKTQLKEKAETSFRTPLCNVVMLHAVLSILVLKFLFVPHLYSPNTSNTSLGIQVMRKRELIIKEKCCFVQILLTSTVRNVQRFVRRICLLTLSSVSCVDSSSESSGYGSLHSKFGSTSSTPSVMLASQYSHNEKGNGKNEASEDKTRSRSVSTLLFPLHVLPPTIYSLSSPLPDPAVPPFFTHLFSMGWDIVQKDVLLGPQYPRPNFQTSNIANFARLCGSVTGKHQLCTNHKDDYSTKQCVVYLWSCPVFCCKVISCAWILAGGGYWADGKKEVGVRGGSTSQTGTCKNKAETGALQIRRIKKGHFKRMWRLNQSQRALG